MKARHVVAVAIAVYLLLVFLDRFVLVELLIERIGTPLLLAIAVALAAAGAGFLALRGRCGLPRNLVIGIPLLGTICFLVGLLRISSWTMVPIVGIFGGIGAISLARRRVATLSLSPWAFAAIAAVFVCGFIAAQAPPSTLDELAYHLAVPWSWVKNGRAIALPLNSHSYFPMGVESAGLPFLAILGTGGGIASHFLHLFAAAATMLLLLRLARGNGLIAAAIVTTPALAICAGWSLVDWNLLGVSVALVMALEADDPAEIGPAIAAGLLTKYTFIPIAAIAVLTTRRFRGLLPGAIAGSVFFIRNLILTGNPVAPFFGALAPHVANYRVAYLSDYIFSGRFIDESLGASMLMSCTLAAGALSWILIAAGAVLFFLAPSARLLAPFFAIPAAHAEPPGRLMRVLLIVAVAAQLLLLGFFTERSGAFGLLAGRVSDEQYLANARPSTSTIAALDAALPAHSRTLVIGLSETFWFRHDVRGGGNFDGPRVSHYLEAGSSDALRARLRAGGITHVAVISIPPPTDVGKKIEERETALSPEAQRTLAQMLDRYATSVARRGEATLFALR